MKKLLLLLVILNLFQNPTLKAQYVTIPDAHFVAFLQANFPSCMVGNQMDTTCAAITGATGIDCSSDSIADLTGVQYFNGLQNLYCSDNLLTSLPSLPNNLTLLWCDINQLSSLPTLPSSLLYLQCNHNHLSVFPSLPNSLITLSFFNNQFTSLPSLPTSLTVLDCSYNQLASLPTLPNTLINLWCNDNQLNSLPSLPNTLQDLICNNNAISTLPALPNTLITLLCQTNQLWSLPTLSNSLQTLDCYQNLLTSLPSLPNSLQYLTCSSNHLTALPNLPNLLQQLNCGGNYLTSLPVLPNSLQYLECGGNYTITSLPILPNFLNTLVCGDNLLTSLPSLPNALKVLLCGNNNIPCFPIFPNSLTDTNSYSFNISPNPFNCLPNYVPAMNATYLAYPLCLSGNTNGCSIAQGIVGYTYKDNNANCSYSTVDSTKLNIHEKLYDSGSNLISQTFSAMNGVYVFPEPAGTYTVNIDTAGVPYTVQCVHPGIDSLCTLTNAIPLITNVNFPITCKAGFDVGVQSVVEEGMVFPNIQHTIKFVAGDISNWYNLHCAAGIAGQVVVTVTGNVTYNTIVAGSLTPTVAGNVFTYNIADFGTLNSSTAFGLVFTTNSTAVAGDVICVNVSVTPTAGDNNTSNNTYNYCYTVRNSYDPNYKETYPVNVPVGFVDYFTYTIHFQNTGTAAANNIHLLDTLDGNLDLNTFQVINYSHYNTTWLTGNKLSVNFPNINLPDSSSDFAGSQGFIQYRIKPKVGLVGGTLIHNTASIYFDYNAAIITNTSVNEFMLATGNQAIKNKQSTLNIYPNPSTGKYSIKLSDGTDVTKLTIEVTNLLGEVILESKIQHSISFIDISNQPSGVYFVRVIGGEQALNVKVVKE